MSAADDYVEPHEADFWEHGFDERTLGYYVLDADNNVRGPVPMRQFDRWMVRHKPTEPGDPPPWRLRVARDEIGDQIVSTVFLGRDLGFGETPQPKTFETMLSGPEEVEAIWRHATWAEAEGFHQRLTAALRSGAALSGAWWEVESGRHGGRGDPATRCVGQLPL